MNIEKAISKYLDMEAYGSNLIIKNYCGFPKYLPLPCHIEHGWTSKSEALISDLEIAKDKGLMLVFSERRLIAWQKKSCIPAEIIGAPFILYRKMMGIKQSLHAKGTIVFPSHSTIFLESRYDINDYCNELNKLPRRYRPIDICLFHLDIKKGRGKIFSNNGFRVVSAGRNVRGSMDFVHNHYKILSQYKYATSNEIGSYAFYAVEMGIPFFLYGKESYIINLENKDPNVKRISRGNNFKLYKEAKKLFIELPAKNIKKIQFKYVASEISLYNKLSSNGLSQLLWKNTKNVNYWVVKVPLYCILTLFKYIIPDNIVYWLLKNISRSNP